MEFLQDYGLFLAKTLTLTVAVLVVAAGLVALGSRGRPRGKDRLEVIRLNERLQDLAQAVSSKLLDRKTAKHARKALQRERKQARGSERQRIYVIEFHGDLRASQVDCLRQEVSAVLLVARPEDEVVVKLESPGGLVPNYGLAASQLARLRGKVRRLTVCIDRVAASGGYLMACVADRILAAPFAIVGSVGVVAQLPNFHRLLRKNDIDYELITAGKYKRTLTVFGENHEEGREKMRQELEETHALFKDFIRRHRSGLDVERVATGEYWLGERALELGLVDALSTSDDYLLAASREADLIQVRYHHKQPLGRRLSLALESLLHRAGSS